MAEFFDPTKALPGDSAIVTKTFGRAGEFGIVRAVFKDGVELEFAPTSRPHTREFWALDEIELLPCIEHAEQARFSQ